MAELKTMEIPKDLPVMKDGKPFFFQGGKTGVLLVHGFTGTTSSMKPMGEYLAAKGFTVLGPRLPGHGTNVIDMGRYTFEDWIAAAETAFLELQGMCDKVFVSGLSMGGLLTLCLGENHPEIAGLIPVSAPAHWLIKGRQAALLPLVPVLKYLVRTFPGPGNDVKDPSVKEIAYDDLHTSAMHELIKLIRYVDGKLDRIAMPIRIYHAKEDHVVPTENAPYIFEHVASKDKKLIWLENSYHVATLDLDKEKIFEETYNFIKVIGG